MVTMEKEYTVDDKIQEIEERIAREDFVRCHTSFLVNFSYVKECTKKKMLLENGKLWISAGVTGKRRKRRMWNG